MPDFLSRLVGRTFGLIPVAKPVTRSIFAPESPVRNDYMQASTFDSESVSGHDNAGIDSFQDYRNIRQRNELSLDQKKSLNKDCSKDSSKPQNQIQNPDSQSDPTFKLKPSHNVSSHSIKPGKNNSDFPEHAESIFSYHMSEQDNQHLHTQPAAFSQDNNSTDETYYTIFKSGIFKPDTFEPNTLEPNTLEPNIFEPNIFEPDTLESNTFESTKPDFSYNKNPDNLGVLKPNKIPISNAKQFRSREQAIQGYIEPFENNAVNSPDKKLIEHEPDSDLRSKVLPNLRNGEPILQNNEPVSIVDFRTDLYAPAGSYPDTLPRSIIPRRQNLKQTGDPKARALMKKTDNTLLEQHTAAVKFPSTAPTIKVTIGRIEVRAVKPLPEPQLQAPPKQQPILSLDDYLKQYNG